MQAKDDGGCKQWRTLGSPNLDDQAHLLKVAVQIAACEVLGESIPGVFSPGYFLESDFP